MKSRMRPRQSEAGGLTARARHTFPEKVLRRAPRVPVHDITPCVLFVICLLYVFYGCCLFVVFSG